MNNLIIEKDITKKLDEILSILESNVDKIDGIGSLSGTGSVILFAACKYQIDRTDRALELIEKLIERSIKIINQGFRYSPYCAGLAGFFWTMVYLIKQGLINRSDLIFLASFDDFLIEELDRLLNERNYDLLHGGLGIAYYFVERFSLEDQREESKIFNIVNKVLNKMQQDAVAAEFGVFWKNTFKSDIDGKDRNIDLGLAHGQASFLSFLNFCYYSGFNSKLVYDLIEKSQSFLFSCKIDARKYGSYFPNSTANMRTKSRLAWCYGDLGLGFSLCRSGEITRNKTVVNMSKSLFRHASGRCNLEHEQVVDACLCHGSAGLAFLFLILNKRFDELKYKRASEFWIHNTIQRANHQDGYAGYKTLKGKEKKVWLVDTSFLEGVAGIGIALMCYLDNNLVDDLKHSIFINL